MNARPACKLEKRTSARPLAEQVPEALAGKAMSTKPHPGQRHEPRLGAPKEVPQSSAQTSRLTSNKMGVAPQMVVLL